MRVFWVQRSCSNKSAVLPIFLFLLFTEGSEHHLIPSVHPHLLESLLVLMLSLSNHGWMCVRDSAQCQGGPWLNLSQAAEGQMRN